MLQSDIGAVQSGATAIGGLSFMVTVYFLRDFVRECKEFMRDISARVVRLEAHLSLAPEDVGSFSPRHKTHSRGRQQ